MTNAFARPPSRAHWRPGMLLRHSDTATPLAHHAPSDPGSHQSCSLGPGYDTKNDSQGFRISSNRSERCARPLSGCNYWLRLTCSYAMTHRPTSPYYRHQTTNALLRPAFRTFAPVSRLQAESRKREYQEETIQPKEKTSREGTIKT